MTQVIGLPPSRQLGQQQGTNRMENSRVARRPPGDREPDDAVVTELRALRSELHALRESIDRLGWAYLEAKFPYGKTPAGWPR
jgi:hypothetical protein